MKLTTETKMGDFLENANDVLTNIKQEQAESKKLISESKKIINLVRIVGLVIIVPLVTGLISGAVAISNRPTYEEAVTKTAIHAAEKLRLANEMKIYEELHGDTNTLENIKEYQENYLWVVEDLYNIRYRRAE